MGTYEIYLKNYVKILKLLKSYHLNVVEIFLLNMSVDK